MENDKFTLTQKVDNVPYIGFIVTWVTQNIQVEHSVFAKKLKDAGFEDFIPGQPTKESTLQKAVELWHEEKMRQGAFQASLKPRRGRKSVKNNGSGHSLEAELKRLTLANEQYNCFALTTSDIDLTQLGVTMGTELRIWLKKSLSERCKGMTVLKTVSGRPDESVLNEDNQNETVRAYGVEREIRQIWRKVDEQIGTAEVTLAISRIIKSLDAISFRGSGGGVYFVPLIHEDKIKSLQNILTTLPSVPGKSNDSIMNALPQANIKAIKESVGAMSVFTLEDEIEAAEKYMSRFIEENRKKGVRPNTLAARLDEFQLLRDKVEMYAEYMQTIQVKGLLDNLKKLEQRAEGLYEVRVNAEYDTGIELTQNEREMVEV